MIIISTSLTVRAQPSPWFHVEAWLSYKNCVKWTITKTQRIFAYKKSYSTSLSSALHNRPTTTTRVIFPVSF